MEPEQASQQHAGDNANDLQEKKARRKRSRWGAETEAGLQVLAGAEVELQQQQPVAEQQHTQQQQQQQPGSGDGTDAARKKRRSRWEPETEAKLGIIQGLQIALPPAIAALVDAHVDPKTMELQRQLNIVSVLCQNVPAAITATCFAGLDAFGSPTVAPCRPHVSPVSSSRGSLAVGTLHAAQLACMSYAVPPLLYSSTHLLVYVRVRVVRYM